MASEPAIRRAHALGHALALRRRDPAETRGRERRSGLVGRMHRKRRVHRVLAALPARDGVVVRGGDDIDARGRSSPRSPGAPLGPSEPRQRVTCQPFSRARARGTARPGPIHRGDRRTAPSRPALSGSPRPRASRALHHPITAPSPVSACDVLSPLYRERRCRPDVARRSEVDVRPRRKELDFEVASRPADPGDRRSRLPRHRRRRLARHHDDLPCRRPPGRVARDSTRGRARSSSPAGRSTADRRRPTRWPTPGSGRRDIALIREPTATNTAENAVRSLQLVRELDGVSEVLRRLLDPPSLPRALLLRRALPAARLRGRLPTCRVAVRAAGAAAARGLVDLADADRPPRGAPPAGRRRTDRLTVLRVLRPAISRERVLGRRRRVIAPASPVSHGACWGESPVPGHAPTAAPIAAGVVVDLAP